ncbi:hypothetical protein PV325_013569 [Microctonus aethiopoides]|uniref:Myb/SANT-like DNA-binding domain-containing protein n=1 Tax=Microctonus aethiopoides TaxID=144406 RepID=A0AA39KLJ0_9HYME|nr:hypothetical protein PV325_013569 [Microctonus aethiopoides]KAK0091137.1 hypothetical protein PV326_003686 [Microctonus aethiopoides]KAK0165807.1 hypothetical protein PV328_004293 [Microctonus aethiopoides]
MAATKILLYDSEKDIAVEAYVPVAGAERAKTDIFSATQLLRSVMEQKQEPQASTSTLYHVKRDEDITFTPVDKETTEIQESEGNAEDVDSSNMWTSPCVLLLLETYRSLEGILKKGKMSRKKVWSEISEELKSKGYDVTGPQCNSKLRSLKKTYKSTKNYNQKSGNKRKTWQFYEIMDEIFGQKTCCDPVAVASSTGLSIKKPVASDSEVGSDSGCSTKSNKMSIATLLQKRLRQKDEHEENKNKRHKETMEMNERFLKVLEKRAEK